jgi:hypothetical protein
MEGQYWNWDSQARGWHGAGDWQYPSDQAPNITPKKTITFKVPWTEAMADLTVEQAVDHFCCHYFTEESAGEIGGMTCGVKITPPRNPGDAQARLFARMQSHEDALHIIQILKSEYQDVDFATNELRETSGSILHAGAQQGLVTIRYISLHDYTEMQEYWIILDNIGMCTILIPTILTNHINRGSHSISFNTFPTIPSDRYNSI